MSSRILLGSCMAASIATTAYCFTQEIRPHPSAYLKGNQIMLCNHGAASLFLHRIQWVRGNNKYVAFDKGFQSEDYGKCIQMDLEGTSFQRFEDKELAIFTPKELGEIVFPSLVHKIQTDPGMKLEIETSWLFGSKKKEDVEIVCIDH